MAKLIAEARKQQTTKIKQRIQSGDFVEILVESKNLSVGEYAVVIVTEDKNVTCESLETGKVDTVLIKDVFLP